MAGKKQPINLLLIKGNKHLTKEEIERRQSAEIKADSDHIEPPDYLSQSQKKQFAEISGELLKIEIISNLDCNALANYIIALDNYIRFSRLVKRTSATVENISVLEKAVNMQDKAFKQCRAAASDLGLTISSRCKLVVPKKEDEPESKWDKYKSG